MGGRNFTSARMVGKKAFTYGRMEISAQLPAGRHLWPAIWMMPQDSKYGGWAASGEIDIMEARGEKPHVTQGTIHYGGSKPNNIWSGSGEKSFAPDLTKGFHIYAIQWSQTDIKWFVDDQHYHTENINRMMWSGKGKNPYTKNGQPFDQSFHFIFNIAVGGNFFPEKQYGKQVTPEEGRHWPKPTMEIDYVKVFRWEN